MRKIILDLAVTLDGFIEGPNGEIDWCNMDGDTGEIFTDFLAGIDDIFYGRISYDLWGNYQPGENEPAAMKEVCEVINRKNKYVFSRTKNGNDGHASFINDNIPERVQEIRQQPGKDIWLYGGGQLITVFMNLGLVDVYRLAIHPVILGAGKPLFKDIKERVGLTFNGVKTSAAGVMLAEYAVKR
ncbi:dihydrofolate reductase [Chitinophaga agrisoli]|uniref:Dihydrofolate reductase n=1 Tax=Chitinophaga agrisoli TaxID=2607653 RepID=A0A5B2VVX1_9BACT|nr:dihydrofolate reductase family protein [Chitinophaga agrisoli]KAA2243245.1 dihydrofolate reductase [Chitinophaga agrisoli]